MKKISAEQISIGNEILAGTTINTNSAFISQRLSAIGVATHWVTVIADEPPEILRALQQAWERAQVVIITGGLGPTPDDLTKQTLCDFFGARLVESPEVLADLKRFLAHRKRITLSSNKGQALVPEGAEIIHNPIGTAPGLVLKKDHTLFAFFPGVPQEMKAMIEPGLTSILKKNFALPLIETRILRTTGIGESTLHERLKPILAQHPGIPFAYLPNQTGVDLRFKWESASTIAKSEWLTLIEKIQKEAHKYIYTRDERAMEAVLVEILQKKNLPLAVAESFTGGLLQSRITDVAGCSSVFKGGLVAYSNELKKTRLKVQEETLATQGAVSEACALEMALGAQQFFDVPCTIATTGIAGPGDATVEKPVGLCYVAAAYGEKTMVREFHFGPRRLINKQRGAMAGLEMLRRLLLDL